MSATENGQVKIEKFVEIRRNEKAILLEVEKKSIWFPLSKCEFKEDSIFIDKEIYEKNIAQLVADDLVKITSTITDHSEKTYKVIVDIKLKTYEASKFLFVPKSKVVEHSEGLITFPKWIWEKSKEELLNAEVAYYNGKYEEKITVADYEILTKIEEL